MRVRDLGDQPMRAQQVQQLQALVETAFGVKPGARAYVCAPLYHSAPSLFAREALRLGELLVLDPRFDAERVLQARRAWLTPDDVLNTLPADRFARAMKHES